MDVAVDVAVVVSWTSVVGVGGASVSAMGVGGMGVGAGTRGADAAGELAW